MATIPLHKRRWHLAALVALIVVIVALAFSGVTENLLNPDQIRTWALTSGAFGPLLYALLFCLVLLLFIPPTSLTLTAGFLFGPLLGMVLSVICVNIGALVWFILARRMGRESVQRFLPDRMENLDRRLEERGLLAVAFMRLAFVPFSVACISAGLSRIRKRDYLIGTAIGTFPAIFMLTWVGDRVLEIWSSGDWRQALDWPGLISILLFGLAALLAIWLEKTKNI